MNQLDQPPADTTSPDAIRALPRLLITPKTAAQALAISPRKLWSLTNAGTIPCVRLGRSVRYSLTDLQTWIDNHRV